VIKRSPIAVDELNSTRAISMHDGGDLHGPLGPDRVVEHHQVPAQDGPGRIVGHLEPVRRIFDQYGRAEGTDGLAVFDQPIEPIADLRAPGISEQRTAG